MDPLDPRNTNDIRTILASQQNLELTINGLLMQTQNVDFDAVVNGLMSAKSDVSEFNHYLRDFLDPIFYAERYPLHVIGLRAKSF